MSERKDEEEMVGQEDSSEPSEESEELIDADVEQHNSPHSPDEESPAGNGDTPPQAEEEEEESEEDEEESDEGDKNVELGKEEVSLNELKREGSGSPHHELLRANGVSSGDVNGRDEIVKDEDGDEMGEAEADAAEGEVREKVGILESKHEEEEEKGGNLKNVVNAAELDHMPEENGVKDVATVLKHETAVEYPINTEGSNQSFLFNDTVDADDNGTEEEQAAFMKELENFFKERSLDFKPPKFYGEGLNCLKLWRAVTKLGGYDRVTTCKLWRQVGESFKPPKTCTTVSWSFRIFYEKALLDYERHKMHGGELQIPEASLTEPMGAETPMGGQASGSGRARRDAAARAMQGWHSQRLLGNGEVGDPIIKDKNTVSLAKREKQLKNVGLLKRKKPSSHERAIKVARTITKATKPQMDSMVVDVGPAADWVKINVKKTKDCFEVYALVPGLLREEVRVQSDPAGRLVISGDPEQPDNPWGVTPFKKVISLPSRIDPHQTSAVVTLHGQLFVRVPFEQSDI